MRRNKIMKKITLTRLVALGGTAVLLMGAVAGCGKDNAAQEVAETATEVAEVITEEEAAQAPAETAAEVAGAPYFEKGVYVNYAEGATTRDYFYVFYDANAGYTEDANTGTGLPFACEQTDGQISFTFGGEGEAEEVFTVTSTENGIITGSFEDGVVLHFELKEGEDPENFDSAQYASPGSEVTYEDANGWSVRYYSDLFEVNQQDNLVTFVYMGESAGTNMVSVVYDVDMNAEEAIDKMAESWGSDNVTKSQSIFPGTEDVDGYWAQMLPAEDGSGLYETAVARDYMDGYLLFEVTGHNSGDDMLDMEVSDALAMIIDSLEFNN